VVSLPRLKFEEGSEQSLSKYELLRKTLIKIQFRPYDLNPNVLVLFEPLTIGDITSKLFFFSKTVKVRYFG
jgi:hypothetical protein